MLVRLFLVEDREPSKLRIGYDNALTTSKNDGAFPPRLSFLSFCDGGIERTAAPGKKERHLVWTSGYPGFDWKPIAGTMLSFPAYSDQTTSNLASQSAWITQMIKNEVLCCGNAFGVLW